ncbi:Homocysteine S-methyltransferase [Mycena kentingensis (nom. inval.)]|nr:Homocysteine S-methyltransferase [Mycena kentingensis (nom. inval.)]
MGLLATPLKPWWISFVFPEIVAVTFAQSTASTPAPSAIGVNCTQVEELPGIVAQLEEALPELEGLRPWLILYPNACRAVDCDRTRCVWPRSTYGAVSLLEGVVRAREDWS